MSSEGRDHQLPGMGTGTSWSDSTTIREKKTLFLVCFIAYGIFFFLSFGTLKENKFND